MRRDYEEEKRIRDSFLVVRLDHREREREKNVYAITAKDDEDEEEEEEQNT